MHKGSLEMPKRKARPVTVSTPQKGRSKLKGGIPLDELLAAHAAGRTVRATEKTPARASAAAKAPKTKPKKAPGRRLPHRDDVQVVQDGPPLGWWATHGSRRTTRRRRCKLMR